MLEIFLLVLALSLDAFVVSFAYGTDHIKIPVGSSQVISILCTLMLGASLFIGSLLQSYLPASLTKTFCFGILFFFGIIKLFDGLLKGWIRQHTSFSKKVQFTWCNLHFIFRIYADPAVADQDLSKTLSAKEAVALAFALSLDGLAVGVGIGMMEVHFFMTMLLSFLIHNVVILLGSILGNKLAARTSLSLTWLSGALLLILAFLKL